MNIHINRQQRWLASLMVAATLLSVFSLVQAATGDESEQTDQAADNSETADVDVLGPYGGDLWDVAIDSTNGMIYTIAKDSPNGFYRSDDGGEHWAGLTGVDYGGGIAVEVDADSGAVYAVFDRGLYKSVDQGVTFTNILTDSGSALVYGQDMIMMASNNTIGNVRISVDGGDNFTASTVASDETVWSIASSATAGTWYAVTYTDTATNVYVTTNNGSSWSQLVTPTFPESFAETHVCADPTDANVIAITGGYSGTSYVSANAGTSWTAVTARSVACAYDTTGRLFIGEQYSDDNGATWTSFGADGSDSTALGGHNVTVDPSDVNVVYADGMPGLSKSTDRGATWEDINAGILGVTITDISQATDKDIVWAAAYNGVAKTENFTSGNPTWQFPVLEDPATSIWTLASNPDVVVVGEIGTIKRSTDGGVTWSDDLASEFLTHDYQVDQIIQDVSDENILYAAVVNGEPSNSKVGMVLKSTDQGLTWENMGLLDGASAQTISQASNGDLYVGVGADTGDSYKTGIYKYSEGTWTKLTNSPDEEIVVVLVDPENDDVVYAVASIAYGNGDRDLFGFYKSTDAGETWAQVTTGLDTNREYTSLAIQTSTQPNTLYLGAANMSSQGVLYKSSDAGETWDLFYTGLVDESFHTLIFDGVTVGSTRGLFDLKSKATVRLRAADRRIQVNTKASLTVTLKDAITDKKLKHQNVKLYQKKGGSYQFIDTVRTNANGKANLDIRLRHVKQYKFKAKWIPRNNRVDEYTNSHSTILNIRATQ